MRLRRDVLLSVAVIGGLLAVVVTHPSLGDEPAPHWVKGMLCLACHKSLNKELVERFQTTKHSKVQPDEKMSPLDLYRRSVGFNAADSTYFEAGLGCQTCHGPGSAHLAAKGNDEKLATMPRPDQLKTANQKLSICGRCHADYTYKGQPFAPDFRPGDDLIKDPDFKLNEVTKPADFQQLNDFMHSKHAQNDITCITCHTSHEQMTEDHQLRKPVPDVCLQCHATAHPCKLPEAQWPKDSTCVTCHMPGGRHVFAVQK